MHRLGVDDADVITELEADDAGAGPLGPLDEVIHGAMLAHVLTRPATR